VVLPLVTATDRPVVATGVSRRGGDAGARHRNHSVRGRRPDGSSRVARPRYASQVGDFQTVPGSLRNGARAACGWTRSR